MSIYTGEHQLRVKRKSLAEEAKILRLEKRKAKAQARWARANGKNASLAMSAMSSMQSHLDSKIKTAARTAHIAHGLLRGRNYKNIENKYREGNAPNWDEVIKCMMRFGLRVHSKQNAILAAIDEEKISANAS